MTSTLFRFGAQTRKWAPPFVCGSAPMGNRLAGIAALSGFSRAVSDSRRAIAIFSGKY
jgi:hypothetical protein